MSQQTDGPFSHFLSPTDGVSIETLLQFPQEIIGGLSSCWNTYEYHVQKSEQRADDGGYLENDVATYYDVYQHGIILCEQ